MGPAALFDKVGAALGSLLAVMICPSTEGYALGIETGKGTVTKGWDLDMISELNECIY